MNFGCLSVKNTTQGVLQRFVGQYGNAGIEQFLIKKLIQSPLEIICHACALMRYWVGLFAEMDQEQLVEGANTMLKVAQEILATQTARQVDQLLLQDGGEPDQDGDPTREM